MPHLADRALEITLLCNAREHAVQLARWHAAEWGHLYADWNETTALDEFMREQAATAIPFTMIAHRGPTLMGSVSIIEDDLPGWPQFNPWLASFFVAPPYRKSGIGAALLEAAIARLGGTAIDRVYLFTESAAGYFTRHGFREIAVGVANARPVAIMARPLEPRAQCAFST